jgi:hypothetical protein
MSEENRQLWKAIIEWLEIARETDEKLLLVRQELAKIVQREEPKHDLLKVQLY